MDTQLISLVDDMAQTIAGVKRSLVIVQGKRDSAGAGITWRRNGVILTNNHVLNGRAPRIVLADGRTFEAEIIRRDADLDLALLRTGAQDLPPAQVIRGTSQALVRVGELVYALGHPWGERNFVTAGIVSGYGKLKTRSGQQVAFIRTDARLAPGNSGGPLLNASGQVVGINTMIMGGDQGMAILAQVADDFASQALGENTPGFAGGQKQNSEEGFI